MYMLNKRHLKCKIIIGKKGLNSDGHGFHQYQQKTSDQSHLIFNELTEHKNTTTCNVRNPGHSGWRL